MSLEVKTTKKEEGVYFIIPAGEINSDTYSILQEKIDAVLRDREGIRAIVFDLSQVSYISSMGLGVLFKVKQALEDNKGVIMLINPQPQIKDVFDTMKFMPDYMFADLEEADEYLDKYLDALQKGQITPRKHKR